LTDIYFDMTYKNKQNMISTYWDIDTCFNITNYQNS